MVGRQAQIMPRLISTPDQMIDGVPSSDRVSARRYMKQRFRWWTTHVSVVYLHEKSERLTMPTVYARAMLAPQILREGH